MKYIKQYKGLNESKFNNVIYGIGLFLIASNIAKMFSKSDTDYLYDCIKTQNTTPSVFVKNKVDSIKNYLYTEIDSSNYTHKQDLKDSIANIPIFIADLSKLSAGESNGCKLLLDKEDFKKNVIFIDTNIDKEDVAGTILHEIYHYIVDTEKINYLQYVDKRALTDKDYLLNKICIIYTGISYDKEIEEISKKTGVKKEVSQAGVALIKSIYNLTIKKQKYYTRNSEISVRLLELKHWLLSQKQIKSVTQELNRENLMYILDNQNDVPNNFLVIFPYIDFNKLFNLEPYKPKDEK